MAKRLHAPTEWTTGPPPINGYEGDDHRMTDGPRIGEYILTTAYGCICGERHIGWFWQGYWERRKEESKIAVIEEKRGQPMIEPTRVEALRRLLHERRYEDAAREGERALQAVAEQRATLDEEREQLLTLRNAALILRGIVMARRD